METTKPTQKHTPGEWHVVNYAGFFRIQASPYYEGNDILDSDKIGEEVAGANAKLIAAAPDLLEALKEMCDAQGRDIDLQIRVHDKALLAIKKATE